MGFFVYPFLVMVVVIMVMIPVTLAMPPVVRATPIPAVLVPAALAFRIQIPTSTFCLGATLPMMTHRLIQPRFSLFDPVLAFRMVIVSLDLRYARKKQRRTENGCRKHSGRNFQRLLLEFVHSMPPVGK